MGELAEFKQTEAMGLIEGDSLLQLVICHYINRQAWSLLDLEFDRTENCQNWNLAEIHLELQNPFNTHTLPVHYCIVPSKN